MKDTKHNVKLSINKVDAIKGNTIKLLAMASSLLLAGCSSSSTQPSNNIENTGFGKPATCQSGCTKVEFHAEPVVNINYTCGSYKSVTSQSGFIECPNKSTAKLVIQGEKTKRKIELGSVKVQAISNTNPDQYLVRRSLIDFISTKEINNSNEPEVTTAINIIRFLDAMRTTEIDGTFIPAMYNRKAPVNKIVINENIKNNLDKYLKTDITLDDFRDGSFEEKTREWLASHGLAVKMTAEDALNILEKGLTTKHAAVYFRYGQDVNLTQNVQSNPLKNGIHGKSLDQQHIINMNIYGLTTRHGNGVGHGLYWKAENTQQDQSQPITFYDKPYSIITKQKTHKSGLNVYSQRVSDFEWIKESENTTDIIRVENGKLFNNSAIIGNKSLKGAFVGTQKITDKELGSWKQTIDGAEYASGVLSIYQIPQTNVSNYFDKNIWRTKTTVKQGSEYIFPLYAELTFKDNQNNELANEHKIGITVLENGDIITDGSNNQNVAYPLGTPNCRQENNEKPIGTIRVTSERYENEIGSFINPSILLAGTDFKQLNGVHIGTFALTNKPVTIDISAILQSQVGTKGALSIFNMSNKKLRPATWANIYSYYTNRQIEAQQINADKKVETGVVTIQPSECYQVKQRLN